MRILNHKTHPQRTGAEDMEEGDYLMMDPAYEVNEKGTREKNDGNEALGEVTSPPLDLDPS